jgi:natural product biosynthesis luciferase-like monooxygenase protein
VTADERPRDGVEAAIMATIVEHSARELGVEVDAVDPERTFLAAGADSLLMVNVVRELERRYAVTIAMRELFEEADSPALLTRLVADRLAGAAPAEPPPEPAAATRPARFSLYYFGNYPRETPPEERYELLFESARFADDAGFHALWLPERHFHAFGGIFPSPSLLAAALARETRRIRLHAGSVVLPLHNPIRVAEEWSVVDNLSGGRVGIGVASGWHPNDFALDPNAYGRHRQLMYERLETVRALWRGEAVPARSGTGEALELRLHPPPIQPEPPLFTAILGNPDSWRHAGAAGLGVITNLMTQSVAELAERAALYREARAGAGHDPAGGQLVVLMHTYLAPTDERARADAADPFCAYLRSSLSLFGELGNSLGLHFDLERASEEDLDYLLRRGFARYCDERALIGTVESCARIAADVLAAGADEIACFVDFGVARALVRESMPLLVALRDRFVAVPAAPERSTPPPASAAAVPPPAVAAPPRPAAEPLLFCLAHAGGSATSAYGPWRAELEDLVRVVPLELAGHGPRAAEEGPTDARAAAAACAEQIAAQCDGAPFALFGHSIGGLLAYEIDALLAERGARRPAAVAIAATPAPSRPQPEPPLHELPEEQFVAAVAQLGGLPDLVLEHPEARAFHVGLLRGDYRLVERHRLAASPHRLSAPLLILLGSEDPLTHPDDAVGWRALADGPVAARTLAAAGHFFPGERRDETLATLRGFLAPALAAARA